MENWAETNLCHLVLSYICFSIYILYRYVRVLYWYRQLIMLHTFKEIFPYTFNWNTSSNTVTEPSSLSYYYFLTTSENSGPWKVIRTEEYPSSIYRWIILGQYQVYSAKIFIKIYWDSIKYVNKNILMNTMHPFWICKYFLKWHFISNIVE